MVYIKQRWSASFQSIPPSLIIEESYLQTFLHTLLQTIHRIRIFEGLFFKHSLKDCQSFLFIHCPARLSSDLLQRRYCPHLEYTSSVSYLINIQRGYSAFGKMAAIASLIPDRPSAQRICPSVFRFIQD